MRGRWLALIAAAGAAAATGTVLLVVASDHQENMGATAALAVSVGVAFVASGLVGERFTFLGYLPRRAAERERYPEGLKEVGRDRETPDALYLPS